MKTGHETHKKVKSVENRLKIRRNYCKNSVTEGWNGKNRLGNTRLMMGGDSIYFSTVE